jgi:hypothetical protein
MAGWSAANALHGLSLFISTPCVPAALNSVVVLPLTTVPSVVSLDDAGVMSPAITGAASIALKVRVASEIERRFIVRTSVRDS